MNLKIFITLFLILTFLSSTTFAQEINVETKGTCKDFDVLIKTNLQGCCDAKVEAPGQVLHADGWKSSFFYVNNAMCNGEAQLKLMLDVKDDVTASLKLRQNTTILEKTFEIDQKCPIDFSDREFLLLIAAIIIVLAAGIAIYAKPKARKSIKIIRRKRKR
jgi:hypothetical protein